MTAAELNSGVPLVKTSVLGVGISAINLSRAVALVFDAIRRREKGYICVTGVHGVMEAQRDELFRKVLNSAFLCTPDGMPMVWMSWLQGRRGISRVYGPDLMEEVLRQSPAAGVRHFLYGGYNGTGELLKRKLLERFPGLQIVGVFEPPFRPLNADEEKALISQVSQSRPDIIWVGISTPKQEFFMANYLPKLDTALMIGVGAAFDFFAGLKRQAPRWMQRSGLEWLFRLGQDPKRLFRRYLRNNPDFLWRALLQLSRVKRYPLP
jgi:N-acetylglucosaminyldiphosphoundecaprenol N-acetyl-beta-D-mannosaminyltransferase